jgi:two-component system sensor kinase FixL
MSPDSASTLVSAPEPSQDLQGLLDAAVDAIVIIDHRGCIQSFSRSAEQLFGYSREEMIGRNVSVLMPERDRAAHDGYLARYLRTREPHIVGRGREVNAQRKDGTVLPVQLAVGTVPHCEPPRFVGFIQDLTRQRQDEANAARLQDRLTHVARLATIGEMASGVAHELNQPLAAIATYAHACERLLGVPTPDIEEVQTALREIAGQAVRAGDIIRRLRSLARAEDLQRRPVDINTVIVELTELIQPNAQAHEVTYRVSLDRGLPLLSVDRGQVQQVILNLVRNALEALAEALTRGGEILLHTRRSADGDVEICVCDNGPGVAPGMVDRMFDPFCTSKPTGTGLGLAISRTIVRAHEGTLSYRSNEPAGACFTIKLPPARA